MYAGWSPGAGQQGPGKYPGYDRGQPVGDPTEGEIRDPGSEHFHRIFCTERDAGRFRAGAGGGRHVGRGSDRLRSSRKQGKQAYDDYDAWNQPQGNYCGVLR